MLHMMIDEKKILSEYRTRTRASMKLFEKAEGINPGGVNANIKFFKPYPIFMRGAKGSKITDEDGNEYIDYLLTYGALILGHGSEPIRRAVERVLDRFGTTVTGTPTGIEIEYGELLAGLYSKGGLIRFTNSGLEATLLAVRLARAFTGRTAIAKFEGHYHGANDRLLVSYRPPSESSGERSSPKPVSDSLDVGMDIIAETIVLPFNDFESTEKLLTANAGRIACVIMEPFEDGVIPAKRDFMSKLKRLTEELGILLVFDEVKTGFRIRIGGAAEYYSVTPDISCLGKVIGGGFPVGAVVGRCDIMSLIQPGDSSGGRSVFHSGTFGGNPVTLSAGLAAVEELMKDGNFERLSRRTESLRRAMASSLAEHQIPAVALGEGSMLNIYLGVERVENYRDTLSSEIRLRSLLDLAMICKGIYTKPGNRYCLSLSHSDDDIVSTTEKFNEVLDEAISEGNRAKLHG